MPQLLIQYVMLHALRQTEAVEIGKTRQTMMIVIGGHA